MLGWKICWVGRYAGLEDMLGWKVCWVGRYAGLEDVLGWRAKYSWVKERGRKGVVRLTAGLGSAQRSPG